MTLRAPALPYFKAFVGLALLGHLSAPLAQAQEFPNRPIRVIVPFGAGSAADAPARRVAQEMSKLLGQPVVIDNRAGAGGIVGTELTARAPADGYTLLTGSIGTHALNVGLYKSLPYDPVRSFEPVSRFVSFSNILVVPTSLGVKNMAELLSHAKRQKEPMSYASVGTGTTLHLLGEMFSRATGQDFIHVPYTDHGKYIPDLISGRTSMSFANLPTVLPHIKAGKLVPIAVSTAQRSPLLPEVPTMVEAGFPDFQTDAWMAFFAPAGTPAGIVQKLNQAVAGAVRSAAVREAFESEGNTPVYDASPAALGDFNKVEMKRWTKIIEDAKLPKQ